eukprot:m.123423 g.123423  ORF g.123423 m.123423 type:complete len:60 (+) comp14446_c0_seq2:1864-2043(+)
MGMQIGPMQIIILLFFASAVVVVIVCVLRACNIVHLHHVNIGRVTTYIPRYTQWHVLLC